MVKPDPFSKTLWRRIDEKIKSVDEDVWLSSRYATQDERRGLMALYYFKHELARIKIVAKEPLAGQMRFAWWRSRLDALEASDPSQRVSDGELAACFVISLVGKPALDRLIDTYEAQFLGDTPTETPDWVTIQLAGEILCVNIDKDLLPFVMSFARLRAGRANIAAKGDVWPVLPTHLRPILAHMRLRRLYQRGKTDPATNPLSRRGVVFWAVLTGKL